MGANELPFEVFRKIFSYLHLDEVLRARAVSRQWCAFIDCFNLSNLLYSEWPRKFIFDQKRLVSGPFATNFIPSLSFDSFFNAYADSILVRLKHLRICDLKASSALSDVLNSFTLLKNLELIRIVNLDAVIHLVSLSLENLYIEELEGLERLTLDAPKLLNIRIWFVQYPKMFDLQLVRPEQVESVELDFYNGCLNGGGFKNLKFFYVNDLVGIPESFLQNLEQLREIHLIYPYAVLRSLLNQKQAYERSNLKIFYHGLCLPANEYPESSDWLNETVADLLIDARNAPNLADKLLYKTIGFSSIERVFARMPDTLWKRFTNLRKLYVPENPQNMQEFREFLGKFNSVLELEFHIDGPRCQRLLDQLADYCPSLQVFRIHCDAGLNFEFVLRFRHLTTLSIHYSGGLFEEKLILSIFRELKCLRKLLLNSCNCTLEINTRKPNEFDLKINDKDFLVFGPDDLMLTFRYWSTRLLFFSR